jgi:16S rRNA processing protein RimM
VQVHTDEPESRFEVGARFATQAEAGSGVPRQLTLRSTRVHRGIWLLAFDEIPDRTGAESLRGTRLFIDAAEAAADADEDSWYEDELVGLTAVDPSGATLGTVAGLDHGPAQDLLVLELAAGGRALVPFVEAIVPEVDVESGRVVVDAPPGLLELNAEQ